MKYTWYSILLEAESHSVPQYGWQNYVSENLANKAATFRLVAQCLNQ